MTEFDRFKRMGISLSVIRDEARRDSSGKVVKVKQVEINKGNGECLDVLCGLVAQDLGYGERLGELCARTPSLTVVKWLPSVATERDLAIMLLDMSCASLCGSTRRNVYIELP